MKQFFTILLAAAVLSMSACSYNPNATATENAASAWNAPATQAEVAILTEIGTNALNAWVSSQVTKGRRQNKEQFIAAQTNKAAKENPNIPRAKINATIRAKLAGK